MYGLRGKIIELGTQRYVRHGADRKATDANQEKLSLFVTLTLLTAFF